MSFFLTPNCRTVENYGQLIQLSCVEDSQLPGLSFYVNTSMFLIPSMFKITCCFTEVIFVCDGKLPAHLHYMLFTVLF